MIKLRQIWYFYNNCLVTLTFRHRNHISSCPLAKHTPKCIKETPSVDNTTAVTCHSRPFPALSMFVLNDWSSSSQRSTAFALHSVEGWTSFPLLWVPSFSWELKWKLRQNNVEAKWRIVTEAKGGFKKQMFTYSWQRRERLEGRNHMKEAMNQ